MRNSKRPNKRRKTVLRNADAIKETLSFPLSDRTIEITVFKKPIKNIYLRVVRGKRVVLSVPNLTSKTRIEEILRKRADWIESTLDRYRGRDDIAEKPPLADGSIFRIFGKRRVVRRIKSNKNELSLSEAPFEIRLYLKEPFDDDLAERTFKKGARREIEKSVRFYVDRWMPIFKEKGIAYPTIRVRLMRSMWGNCAYKAGRITINERVIYIDPLCLDYLVLHELTHFIHHGHDKKFYGFLSRYMPDWQERRAWLRAGGASKD